jgi:MFS family permease
MNTSRGLASGSKPNVLIVLCGVVAVAVMDLSVVNVALPSIQQDLRLAPADVQWVVVTYGIAVAGLLMLGGRLGDLFGHRRVLCVGLSVLVMASAVGGLADSLTILILARAGQGIGAAWAVPNALAILSRTFAEGPERTRALGIFGAAGGTSALVGSIAGGLLVEGPGWPWVFFINVPLGVLIVAGATRLIPADTATSVLHARLDVLGAVSLTTGLASLALGVHQTVDNELLSPAVDLPVALGIVMLLVFAAVESRVVHPLIPIGTLSRPSLLWANVCTGLMWASFLGLIFAGTLFTQDELGWSPLQAGSSTIPIAVLSIVANAVLAPRVMTRLGPATTLAVGLLVMTVGLALLVRVPSNASFLLDLAPAYSLLGLGLGLAEVGAQVAAFTGVRDDEAGIAGGALETAREMGGALGVAVLAAAAVAGTSPTDSYHRIAVGAALLALAGSVVAGTLLRQAARPPTADESHAVAIAENVAATRHTARDRGGNPVPPPRCGDQRPQPSAV